jgi:hypothetical protein
MAPGPRRVLSVIAVAIGTGSVLHRGKPIARPLEAALPSEPKPPAVSSSEQDKRDEAVARAICATCHAFPEPDVLPRSAWRASIEKMTLLRENKDIPGWGSNAAAVQIPADMEAALRYYVAHAPAALPSPEPWPPPDDRVRFARHHLAFPQAATPEPATANVRLADLEGDRRLEVVVSDMRHGLVLLGRPYEPSAGLRVLAQVPHPCHAEVVDLDGDGIPDLLVADLGEFLPGDHTKGAAVWLRGLPGGGYANYSVGGFARVADVEAADFDGDGKLDLVVAAFGWRRVGEVALLENRGGDTTRPEFERRKIDGRTGAIHVIPADLNGDGLMDFVALFAQEHETVVAFINQGPGKPFRAETIYAAPHPNWGSSGIQLVDLDKDGDLDVVMTNGDMFDDRLLKPYHGIQWLENRGTYPFTPHLLAHLPGVHRAVAVDLDGDGDLDIVASVFTAGSLGGAEARIPSLVWLEQVKPGQFVKHTLEIGNPTHATLDVGDFDRDGDLDIVTGVFTMGQRSESWVDVWENLTVSR